MNLQIVGCSHHATSLELRERISFSTNQIPVALAQFRRQFPRAEAVLLSTCNRTELYTASVDSDENPSPDAVVRFLAEFQGLDSQQVSHSLFQHSGTDAVRHLFMVAASLDSMVVGEAQILSQVKQAYLAAQLGESAGQLTHSAFQAALRVAKRVANETSIHQHRVSIPSVAVRDFASQIFDRLDDKKILVVGAGEMAEETLHYLQEEQGREITVINRNHDKAVALAARYQGRAENWSRLDALLVQADLVVSTTGAEQPIVSEDLYSRVEDQRYQRPLFILDLAIPRDFEPNIGEHLGVYLYSIDDLKQVCEANRKARQGEWPRAERIISDETARFVAEYQRRTTGPTIRQLMENAEIVKQAELDRLMNKLEGIDANTRTEIEQSFHRLVNKLLHPPLDSLRSEESGHDHAHLLDSLKRLFKLGDP